MDLGTFWNGIPIAVGYQGMVAISPYDLTPADRVALDQMVLENPDLPEECQEKVIEKGDNNYAQSVFKELVKRSLAVSPKSRQEKLVPWNQ